MYLGRLEKTEGAEAIRLRWYGDVDQKTVSSPMIVVSQDILQRDAIHTAMNLRMSFMIGYFGATKTDQNALAVCE